MYCPPRRDRRAASSLSVTEMSLPHQIKKEIADNLNRMRHRLDLCTEQGMPDTDRVFYNELVDLEDEVHFAETLNELSEVIVKAKTLETDIDTWLLRQGQTIISLHWPSLPY